MRTLLILAALGWITSLPWTLLISHALIVIAIAVLWLISVSMERRAASNSSAVNTIDANYVTVLENMVAEAEAEVEELRSEIERLRSAATSEPDAKAALFRRVGLNESAPQWLVVAARRAYRAALHPDRHPFRHKSEAERRFIEAEAIFDQISARG